MLLLFEKVPGHPIALTEMDNEIHIMFTPANTTCILQPVDQGVIFTSKFYDFRIYLRSSHCVTVG